MFVLVEAVAKTYLQASLVRWMAASRLRGRDVRRTLGGNATLIGASANVVTAGIAAAHAALAISGRSG
jgi:Na+/H+ antiporter NhaD/arsenite permease-like protein